MRQIDDDDSRIAELGAAAQAWQELLVAVTPTQCASSQA